MSQKKCFVIAPIGDDSSLERRKVDTIIRDILKPCLGVDYEVYAAHQITKPGIITSQIVEMIFDSDIIICDLTGVNGNVMYELAIAHLKEKQVIIIAAKGTKLPFDISHQRIIFYDDNIHGTFNLKSDLEEAISKIRTEQPGVENPITVYLHQNRTSLISEAAIKDTIKEAVFDAVNQGSASSNNKIFEKVVKNLEKPSADKIISGYLESQRKFNAEKFYQLVSSTIENGKFPVIIQEFIKEYVVNKSINQYKFDYAIKARERLYLIKISNTVFRVAIQKDAHLMLNSLTGVHELEGINISNVKPLMIIPVEMINPGRLAAKKVPLLKFDSSSLNYTNWINLMLESERSVR